MDTILPYIMHFSYAGLFVLLIAGGIGFPVPEDATLILCGYLISQDFLRPVPALLIAYAGLLAADAIVYHLGKKYGRDIILRPRFRTLLAPEKLAVLEQRFHRRGAWFILIGRHLVGLRVQIFLTAGILRMRFRNFILADALSAIVTIGIMTGIGYFGGNSLEIIRKDLKKTEHVAAFVILVALSVYLVINYFRTRKKQSS